MSVEIATTPDVSPRLVRSLTLTHAVLYGLGVTIGAGIYVLVGLAAGRSGMHAPLAFMGAALVMAFSAEWTGGEARPDLTEIEEARWFSIDALPDLPEAVLAINASSVMWLAALI